MTTVLDTIRLHPTATGTTTVANPARRRLGVLTNSMAAAMITAAPARVRGRSGDRLDGPRVVVEAPAAVALTRRSQCAGITVRGGAGSAHVSAYRGRIAAAGPLVEVTDATARVVLTDSRVDSAAGVLLDARDSQVHLVARDQRLAGSIEADIDSTVHVSLEDGTSFTGDVDRERRARAVTVRLDASSTWTLTGPSHVTRISGLDVTGDTVRNIRGNGRSIRYCRAHNLALRGETLQLTGGGTLRPE